MALQVAVDHTDPSGTLQLQNQEYPGPITISQPMTLDGNGATLWALKGPVLVIDSPAVVLRNLRIEMTGDAISDDPEEAGALVVRNQHSVTLEGVTIRGAVQGMAEEDGAWRYPFSLYIGELKPGTQQERVLRLSIPTACRITSHISGVDIEPRHIKHPGLHEIKLIFEGMSPDTLLFGNLSLETAFVRRTITLSARVWGRSIPSGNRVILPPALEEIRKALLWKLGMLTDSEAPTGAKVWQDLSGIPKPQFRQEMRAIGTSISDLLHRALAWKFGILSIEGESEQQALDELVSHFATWLEEPTRLDFIAKNLYEALRGERFNGLDKKISAVRWKLGLPVEKANQAEGNWKKLSTQANAFERIIAHVTSHLSQVVCWTFDQGSAPPVQQDMLLSMGSSFASWAKDSTGLLSLVQDAVGRQLENSVMLASIVQENESLVAWQPADWDELKAKETENKFLPEVASAPPADTILDKTICTPTTSPATGAPSPTEPSLGVSNCTVPSSIQPVVALPPSWQCCQCQAASTSPWCGTCNRFVGLATGTLVADRFRIVSLLTEHPLGDSYLVQDERFKGVEKNLQVFANNPHSTQAPPSLKEYAALLHQFHHHGLGRTVDYSDWSDIFYIVQEHEAGERLSSLLARSQRLTVDQVENLLIEVLGQLIYLQDDATVHSLCGGPIVHGGVNPAHLLLSARQQTWLLDLGLSGSLYERVSGSTSPPPLNSFTAPEVASGSQASPAADLYSLGMTALALLSGESDPSEIAKDPRWKGLRDHLSLGLEAAMTRMLEENLTRRASSAREVRDLMIRPILRDNAIGTTSESTVRSHSNKIYRPAGAPVSSLFSSENPTVPSSQKVTTHKPESSGSSPGSASLPHDEQISHVAPVTHESKIVLSASEMNQSSQRTPDGPTSSIIQSSTTSQKAALGTIGATKGIPLSPMFTTQDAKHSESAPEVKPAESPPSDGTSAISQESSPPPPSLNSKFSKPSQTLGKAFGTPPSQHP